MNMAWIRHQVMAQTYRVYPHAMEECADEDITVKELEYSLLNGQILEQYWDRNDRRGDRCLVLGYRPQGDYLHVVVTQAHDGMMDIVTAYLPQSPKWLDERTRGEL